MTDAAGEGSGGYTRMGLTLMSPSVPIRNGLNLVPLVGLPDLSYGTPLLDHSMA